MDRPTPVPLVAPDRAAGSAQLRAGAGAGAAAAAGLRPPPEPPPPMAPTPPPLAPPAPAGPAAPPAPPAPPATPARALPGAPPKPAPSIATPPGEAPPLRAPDPAAPFVSVLLVGDGVEADEPPAPAVDPRPRVLGVLCTNDHFNDPNVRYCSVCGISMAQQTLVQQEGPRPPLGVLLMDDGMHLPARHRLHHRAGAAARPRGRGRSGAAVAGDRLRRRGLAPARPGGARRLGRAGGRPRLGQRYVRAAARATRSATSCRRTSRWWSGRARR